MATRCSVVVLILVLLSVAWADYGQLNNGDFEWGRLQAWSTLNHNPDPATATAEFVGNSWVGVLRGNEGPLEGDPENRNHLRQSFHVEKGSVLELDFVAILEDDPTETWTEGDGDIVSVSFWIRDGDEGLFVRGSGSVRIAYFKHPGTGEWEFDARTDFAAEVNQGASAPFDPLNPAAVTNGALSIEPGGFADNPALGVQEALRIRFEVTEEHFPWLKENPLVTLLVDLTDRGTGKEFVTYVDNVEVLGANQAPTVSVSPSTFVCGSEIAWIAGDTMELEVTATDAVDGVVLPVVFRGVGEVDPVTGLKTLVPGILEQRFLPNGTYTWTPGVDDVGLYRLEFTGTDSAQNVGVCWFWVEVLRDWDGDRLADKWEQEGGLDTDGDGLIDVDLPGADYRRKDLFLYIDFMSGTEFDHRPMCAAIQMIKDAFKTAPVPNPNAADAIPGLEGISLHVRVSDQPIDECTDVAGTPIDTFDPVLGKWDPALNHHVWTRPSSDTDTSSTNLYFDDIRDGILIGSPPLLRRHFPEGFKRVFRYSIFGHKYADGGTSSRSGLSRGEPSDSFMVMLGAFLQEQKDLVAAGTKTQAEADQAMLLAQAGTLMHELGHTLNLSHGGFEQTNYKPNYLSVMNYSYQLGGLNKGGTALFDYSRFPEAGEPTPQRFDLDETKLNEVLGLSSWPASTEGFRIAWWATSIKDGDFHHEIQWQTDPIGPGNDPIDWRRGTGSVFLYTSPIPPAPASSIDLDINRSNFIRSRLKTQNDWLAISFKGGNVGAGAPPPPEPVSTPVEELDLETAKTIKPPPPLGLAGRSARGSVRLSWIPAGPRGAMRYRLFRKAKGSVDSPVLIATTTSTLHADRGVTRGATYDYSLTLVNSLGTESTPGITLTVTVR